MHSSDIAWIKKTNDELKTRNAKLAELLKASRDKLQVLHQQLEELAAPPSTYGTYLEPSPNGKTAEVFTAGRLMRLAISPLINPDDLVPGIQVRLGEAHEIVEACSYTTTGKLAILVEMIDPTRALIVDQQGEEHVARLAHPLANPTNPINRRPRAGDTVLVDLKAGYVFEIIPKTEVARLVLEETPDATYADIGGLDTQIEQIHDAVELPFTHPQLYRDYQLHPPKGVLLYGPPGCGKTLIAKAVANSLASRVGDGESSYFINVKGPELLNKYVGETERRIRLIFERARELAEAGRPVIIFFDEMDSIFRTRGSGVSSDMETTVVPQLLTELDGVESLSNVIVIGATNREELIDPAVLRPGRPYVELTLVTGEVETLHYRDFISGAMIANIVDRAKKSAIKAHLAGDPRGITADQLRQAIDAENRESEDMPNTANPDEWSRITHRTGIRVAHARVIGGN